MGNKINNLRKTIITRFSLKTRMTHNIIKMKGKFMVKETSKRAEMGEKHHKNVKNNQDYTEYIVHKLKHCLLIKIS